MYAPEPVWTKPARTRTHEDACRDPKSTRKAHTYTRKPYSITRQTMIHRRKSKEKRCHIFRRRNKVENRNPDECHLERCYRPPMQRNRVGWGVERGNAATKKKEKAQNPSKQASRIYDSRLPKLVRGCRNTVKCDTASSAKYAWNRGRISMRGWQRIPFHCRHCC
jgi:hypothetical protein